MSEPPAPPYGILIWAERIVDSPDGVWIFGDKLHNTEQCRYGAHWDFQFSGEALFLSEHSREVASVKMSTGHSMRGGFFIALDGHRPADCPVLITDALDIQPGPAGILRFVPADPSVEWAGTCEPYGPEEPMPIFYGVLSDGWFGRIQFTSLETAQVLTFSSTRLPARGDRLYFSHDYEYIGSVVSFEADPH